MATKLFRHPETGFVLQTSTEKLHITNEKVVTTDINTEALEEAPADIEVAATIDNALAEASARKSADFIKGVQHLVQHMVESFE